MKKISFLFAIAATLFACTKNDSKPELQEQKNPRQKAITLTALSSVDTTFNGYKWAFVTIDNVVKESGGNRVYFTIHTNDLPILSSGVYVKSDSTYSKWSSIGSGQWGSVWDSPFSTNTFDGYPGRFPQSRLYRAAATTNSIPGSIYSAEYLAN